MNIPTLLRDYAVFNCWANARFAEWLRSLPAEALEAPTPSSFPSLRLTLLHLWDTEVIWLSRLHGESPSTWPSKTFSGTPDELFEGLLASSDRLREYIGSQPDTYFDEETAFRTLDGTASTQVNAQILLHVLQHATFHRGQLVTMGRALGFTNPPKTDYIHYVRLKSSVSEN